MRTVRFPVVKLAFFFSTTLLLIGCGGVGGSASSGPAPGPTATPVADIHAVNHIIFMLQENRSFDHYFGNLNNYRASLGLPQDVDVAPPGVTNPARDGTGPIARFHFTDKCIDPLSPFWNESHRDFNLNNPTSTTGTLDGFANTAGGFASFTGGTDVAGKRAMGFYTEQDLPYYYFMASQFATSDRWFSPVMNRTQPNRIFGLGGSDFGFIYPPGNTGTNDPTPFPANAKNIFQLLEDAHISWRIYSAAGSEDLAGLAAHTYLSYFQPFASQHKGNIVSRSQYVTDVQNGTLAQVSLIEPDGADEHPNTDLQVGAKNVSTLINTLMASSSWKDSVFIFTYDEAGAFYDHVPPQPAVLPDNIPPRFRNANDIPGTYDHTGYRVPLIVISPFAKKNFVSHTVMDYTAILKFIETRFGLPSLSARDQAQPDMTEFFNFANPPWMTPPQGVPTQPTTGPCTFLIP
ncbi:MAG: alkaline phosphatase family protein [Candidatus Angelobacter sp.]